MHSLQRCVIHQIMRKPNPTIVLLFYQNSIILQLKPVLVHLQTILFLSKFSTVKDDIYANS